MTRQEAKLLDQVEQALSGLSLDALKELLRLVEVEVRKRPHGLLRG